MKEKFTDLKSRVISSIALIFLFVLMIFFADLLFMRFVVAIVISAFGYLAALEFLSFTKKKNIELDKNLFLGAVIFEIVAFFITSQYVQLQILPLLVFLIFLIFVFIANFKKIENSLIRIATSVFGVLYIAIPIGMIQPILYLNNLEMQDGRMWLFYLIFVTKITDIGAYFGGKLFGKKKLSSYVSPKKTVAGAVVGMLFALAGSLLFLIFKEHTIFDFNIGEAIILGLLFGSLAQIGDLSESLLKRDVQIKDSANLYGFGGILDMIDSHIFNIPILYMFLIG